MKVGSKEFHELRLQFEKDMENPECPIYISAKLDREPSGSRSFYSNGDINNVFVGYMMGYSNAKSMSRLDMLPLE